jgi:RNA polymerase sigma-70 factor (ECF subfamily)
MDWIQTAMERHSGSLLRYAAGLTGNAETARDVVQETFLRLCRAERGSVEGHLAAWLYTVCRNLALDVHRKERHMAPWNEAAAETAAATAVPPSDAAERAEARSRADAWLDTLPKNQQEVIRLKFQDALSYAEISRVTGLSATNVGYLIHTGLKALRQRLAAAETAGQS